MLEMAKVAAGPGLPRCERQQCLDVTISLCGAGAIRSLPADPFGSPSIEAEAVQPLGLNLRLARGAANHGGLAKLADTHIAICAVVHRWTEGAKLLFTPTSRQSYLPGLAGGG